jgi:hypothetical protein
MPSNKLNQKQRERLQKLETQIQFDKITVSFSIEDRDATGRKKSAFYSATTSRGHGAEVQSLNEETPSAGWTVHEAQIVGCLLSKHVVRATYRDAVNRGLLSGKSAAEEIQAVFEKYDASLASLLGEADETGTS